VQCPCGQSDIPSRDFRAFLASNREALMAARVVTKGEKFGGAVMRKNADGSMYVGPDRGEDEDREDGDRGCGDE
jgi:hypothetical protein